MREWVRRLVDWVIRWFSSKRRNTLLFTVHVSKFKDLTREEKIQYLAEVLNLVIAVFMVMILYDFTAQEPTSQEEIEAIMRDLYTLKADFFAKGYANYLFRAVNFLVIVFLLNALDVRYSLIQKAENFFRKLIDKLKKK